MNILVIGSGGREHALCWKLAQSPQQPRLFIAPGNPGTQNLGTNVGIAADDVDGLLKFARSEAIDLVVVGPEAPLVAGLADALNKAKIPCFGPSRAAAELEGSKVAMKQFLRRHNIPTASFKVFDDPTAAHDYLDEVGGPIVVKCDGLAAGKGVTVAQTVEEAHAAVRAIMEERVFGPGGRKIVIEEVMRGEEISVFAICDGRNAILLDYAQDHKQVFDGDQGPNTGGMGAFTPAPGLLRPRDEDEIVRRILVPTMSGLVQEGRPYVGVLYIGLMLCEGGPKVVEYNVRFGDPECQALMLRLEADLVAVCQAAVAGQLDTIDVSWKPETAICVTLAAPGYPGNYPKGAVITGLEEAEAQGLTIFHAGTALDKAGRVVSNGGRVLSACAVAADIEAARSIVYKGLAALRFDGMQFRKDIGKRHG